MIVAVMEVMEGSPDTDHYLLDTSGIHSTALQHDIETEEGFGIDDTTAEELKELSVEPPQTVEHLITFYVS